MKLVFLSDTHNQHHGIDVPDGDILIHCGDFTSTGTSTEIRGFNYWLQCLPHPYKIVIAGNHEIMFEEDNDLARRILTGAIYLQDNSVELKGFKFYGSPWQPDFNGWAFNLPRGEKLKEKWDKIPLGIDVLITHGPPQGIGDFIDTTNEHIGCADLKDAVFRVKPKIHAFGHAHEAYSINDIEGIKFINAAILDGNYKIANLPVVVDI